MSSSLAWITGAGGLIGNYFVETAPPRWRARGLRRDDLDLLQFDAVRAAFAKEKPSLVIHCAAMSKSPACEAQPDLAWNTNVEATRLLAELASEIPLVFFSTDLVFDGAQGSYDESAAPNPLHVYGRTKVAAENIVLANPRHLVIRTSINGGTSPKGDSGFNEQMRLAWQAGRTLNLFVDEFRAPIHARITARAVWELIDAGVAGMFHVAGPERLSRWEIGQLLAARWPQLDPKVEAGSLKDYHGPPRAPDTTLVCAKAQKLLSFRLPGLTEWLTTHPDEIF